MHWIQCQVTDPKFFPKFLIVRFQNYFALVQGAHIVGSDVVLVVIRKSIVRLDMVSYNKYNNTIKYAMWRMPAPNLQTRSKT